VPSFHEKHKPKLMSFQHKKLRKIEKHKEIESGSSNVHVPTVLQTTKTQEK